MKSLKGTKTLDNLMKAFAGESQAEIVTHFMLQLQTRKDTNKLKIFLLKQQITRKNMLKYFINI